MNLWPTIPSDAIEYFRSAFADANRVATEHILNVPNIRETSLDDLFVNALIPFSPPKRLRSGAVVEMDIHNIQIDTKTLRKKGSIRASGVSH